MPCPQLTRKLGASENVGCFSLMPAADVGQVNKPCGAQPQEDKLIRKATGRAEVKVVFV